MANSLYSMLQWWQASPGSDEEFGGGCVVVGNLDNGSDGANKVATGSFSGMLRVYHPRESVYRVEDLMLETSLDAPILQLAVGAFVGGSNRLALAVLHPRALAVYSITAATGGGGKGGESAKASYYEFTRAYLHELPRPAYCMAHGLFGGGLGRDHLAVQSMDGEVTIWEGERALHAGRLAKFLLPGPLIYNAKADTFLTYTSHMEVDCYK